MKIFNYFIIVYFFLISIAFCDTNEIVYKNFHSKEIAQEKIESLYTLNIKETKKIKIILTGHNIVDYNIFNSMELIKTYSTIKILF
jgi:hypothetical protein